jgi:hypothetical protein
MLPSFDEESTTAGNWKQASSPAEALISRKFKRKKQLPLFEKGRYEFTYNLQGKFQQGQLGMLLYLLTKMPFEIENQSLYSKPHLVVKTFPHLSNAPTLTF